MDKYSALITAFEKAGQGHVFSFIDKLDAAGRERLFADAAEIDLGELRQLCDSLLASKGGEPSLDMDALQPAPYIPNPAKGGDAATWKEARDAGEEALATGRVAAFVVAGGQGTRLGYDGPKGCYPATPVRKASLFQVFAEKIRTAEVRYGRRIPWLIMTSDLNDAATRSFFSANNHFGLDAANVIFFRQGRMPAVDPSGRILLASPGSIAMSPNGHGGALRAIVASGTGARLRDMGIDTISYWQVDNPLVQIIDPAFIGFHVRAKSDMSSKMIAKAYPLEKVGHFCIRDGRHVVIEYSDLPNSVQEQRGADGKLRFLAGSVAIHVFDLAFIEKMGGSGDCRLPFHLARKKIETIDAEGRPIKPDKPNGCKFEMFVFDALPFANNPVVIEGLREDEFSPIKNAEGVDSPETCRKDQLRQWARWAQAAGLDVETTADGATAFDWEVSPLFADSARAFKDKVAKMPQKPLIRPGTLLV
jgi:UDP-N-acetylglucosamine/UDP-N-acetylgalactosamine diphosphorylase